MIHRIRTILALFFMGTTLMMAVSPVASVSAFSLFQGPCDQNAKTKDSAVCKDAQTSQTQQDNSIYGPHGIISKITNILALVVGIAAVLVIMIAGIQYMTSTGDATKVNNAKNAILYAVVGLFVVVIARSVVLFIIGKIT